MISDQSTRKK